MKRKKAFFRQFLTLLCFFFSCFLFAQNSAAQESNQFPSLEPIFSWETNGELSGEDFIRAGLEFSLCPVESEAGHAILTQFKSLESEVNSEAFLALSEEARGEKILSLMYEKVLKQYSLNQTYIDSMFQKGTYNCVSSSILYFALAKSAGLTVHGVETPSHAFCTLYLSDGRKIDVETTNPNGFNPGTKKDISTANSKRYYVVPKKYYSNRKEVSELKFISLIGKNVTAFLDEKQDYARSIPVAATRLAFTKGVNEADAKAVREDFDTATTNYAVSLDRKKKSDRALDWLDAVENRWGKGVSPVVQNLYDNIAYNAAVNLSKAEKSEQAKELFEAKKGKITAKKRLEIRNMIFYSIIDEKTKKMSPESAISHIQQSRTEEEAKDASVAKKLDSLEEYYWSERAKPLLTAKQYLEAAALIDEGLQSLPKSRNLQTMKNQILNNYAVGIHNQFVDFFNAKDYENAERIVKEGLEIVPKNGNLLRDLKTVQSRK